MFHVVSAIVVVAFITFWWRRRGRCTAELYACARERQLRFSRQDVFDVHRRYSSLALMRIGHSRRAWNTLVGTHERGAWVAFSDCCDLGFGADRVGFHRYVAAVEMHTGVEAICVPAGSATRETDPLRTVIDYLSFSPAERVDTHRHTLYVRRPSAVVHPVVARFVDAVASYPRDCVWELGEHVVMVAREMSPRESGGKVVASLLDAVAAVANELTLSHQPARSVQ